MVFGQGQWFTPVAAQKVRQEVWQKIEDTCWTAPKVDLEKEITYFNNNLKYPTFQEYDFYFAYTKTFPLWDERKPKDNRRYLPDIRENIFQQEKDKPVPALTSHIYGRPCRPPYDIGDQKYKRACATKDFERKRGVANIKERKPT